MAAYAGPEVHRQSLRFYRLLHCWDSCLPSVKWASTEGFRLILLLNPEGLCRKCKAQGPHAPVMSQSITAADEEWPQEETHQT